MEIEGIVRMNQGELRSHLISVFMYRPERAADEVLRLREALRRVGESAADAKRIADEALAEMPKADEFPQSPR